MSHTDIEPVERQLESDQSGQADMLQALRSASLPDEFWMYSYKILPCPHGYRHSWTHCPFSHVGETARRRCPRTHSYLPDPCVNARAKRQCPNGDACPYAHNTFEQWLHPARYRTRLCYLGANCRRPTCFFAHSVEELRSVEENENAVAPPQSPSMLPGLLPPLPLPSPSSSGVMPASGPSGDFAPLTPAVPPTAGGGSPVDGPAASPAGSSVGAPPLPSVPAPGPLGILHPVVLMGIPQPMPPPHQGLRPEMLPPPGAVQCFVPYQARHAMLRPAMPMPMPTQLQGEPSAPQTVSLHTFQVPQTGSTQMAAMPVTIRPSPRPHIATPAATMVAAVHHHGSIHMAPAGAVFIHGGMHPHMPPGPPPPPLPLSQSYSSPFVAPGGYYRGGEGVPSTTVRARSYSNPGETAYVVSAGPSLNGACSRTHASGEYQQSWGSVDVSRRISAGIPSSVSVPTAPSPRVGPSGAATAVPAPRHMPAPTNRGGVLRRMSTPAGVMPPSTTTAAAASAAAAASVTTLHPRSAGPSPVIRASASDHEQPLKQRLSVDGVEAALASLSMSKPFAAPTPTPSVSHLAGAGVVSPYSPPLSASSSLHSNSAIGSPSMTTMMFNCDAANAAAVAAAQADLALMHARSSVEGATGGSGYSRPSSAGSGTSGGMMLSAYDPTAAAAALAAVTVGVDGSPDTMAAAGQYHTLLQHVLRSASASGTRPSSGLLPTLLTVEALDADAVHTELYYDDGDVDLIERSSDPGRASIHAAIRRISSEFGSAALSRNSDPGQSMSPAGSDVQLLLPLLQTVLTTGLANGQFELVNGQLQVKGPGGLTGVSSSGPGSNSSPFVAPSVSVAEASTVVLPMAQASCSGAASVVNA